MTVSWPAAALLRARTGTLLVASFLGGLAVVSLLWLVLPPWGLILALLVAALLAGVVWMVVRRPSARRRLAMVRVLRRTLPPRRTEVSVGDGAATIRFDRSGVPTIRAESRNDALRALGWVTAADRLFQMDFTRREAAGRLSQLFGPATLELDVRRRAYDLCSVADSVVASLPDDQRTALESYAAGVNEQMARPDALPFECHILSYRPDRWQPRDSVLCLLSLFTMLCGDERPKRMGTMLRAVLPADVVAFLTPDVDGWDEPPGDRRSPSSLNDEELGSLLAGVLRSSPAPGARSLVELGFRQAGSNCWAIDGTRTHDGRPLLANDMHMGLGVPNPLYCANLTYGGVQLSGVLVPGIPLVVAGDNGRVSWGMTNLPGDCLDLVELEPDVDVVGNYLTPDGSTPVVTKSEVVDVRGGEPHRVDVHHTIWGPVAPERLVGKRVAIRWSALDPDAVDLGLIHLDRAGSAEEAAEVAARWGGPPVNFIAADDGGAVARTTAGRLPVRHGTDGSSASSWADGRRRWAGYAEPADVFLELSPKSGYVVSANSRPPGAPAMPSPGFGYADGWREYRIREMLADRTALTVDDLRSMQLDVTAGAYEYYRELVLGLPGCDHASRDPQRLDDVASLLATWDGRADPEGSAFAVLVAVREHLAGALLSPFLTRCAELDPDFMYRWGKFEVPLRWLVDRRRPELLPGAERFRDWDEFLLTVVDDALDELLAVAGVARVTGVRWGAFNRARIGHVLAGVLPGGDVLLAMDKDELAGCLECLRTATPDFGSAMRMVVSPGRPREGHLHTPCGQSGHPLSPHFADLHRTWMRGSRLPFGPEASGQGVVPARVVAVDDER